MVPPHIIAHADLLNQAATVASSILPSSFPLINAIDRQIPIPLKQLVAEFPLNRLFAGAIADGEFDAFEGRIIRLELAAGGPGISLGFWCSRLRVVEGPGEATIRGSVAAFRQLAERKQDPDQLFFQRKLMIEGDTELGLGLRNLLDSLEWSLAPALWSRLQTVARF